MPSLFQSIPSLPDGLDPELVRVLNGLRENIEVLANMRATPTSSAAVLKGYITTDYPAAIQSPSSGATATQLRADLARLQDTLNNLMINLKT